MDAGVRCALLALRVPSDPRRRPDTAYDDVWMSAVVINKPVK